MGAVGCLCNCAEATVKDIGLIGQEGSCRWLSAVLRQESTQSGSAHHRRNYRRASAAAVSSSKSTTRESARTWTKLTDFVERVGIETVRKKPCMPRTHQEGPAGAPAQVE